MTSMNESKEMFEGVEYSKLEGVLQAVYGYDSVEIIEERLREIKTTINDRKVIKAIHILEKISSKWIASDLYRKQVDEAKKVLFGYKDSIEKNRLEVHRYFVNIIGEDLAKIGMLFIISQLYTENHSTDVKKMSKEQVERYAAMNVEFGKYTQEVERYSWIDKVMILTLDDPMQYLITTYFVPKIPAFVTLYRKIDIMQWSDAIRVKFNTINDMAVELKFSKLEFNDDAGYPSDAERNALDGHDFS